MSNVNNIRQVKIVFPNNNEGIMDEIINYRNIIKALSSEKGNMNNATYMKLVDNLSYFTLFKDRIVSRGNVPTYLEMKKVYDVFCKMNLEVLIDIYKVSKEKFIEDDPKTWTFVLTSNLLLDNKRSLSDDLERIFHANPLEITNIRIYLDNSIGTSRNINKCISLLDRIINNDSKLRTIFLKYELTHERRDDKHEYWN